MIFLVDDDLALSRSYRRMLELKGYQVESFFNGADALNAFSVVKPALCIIDLLLPGGMNGFLLTQKIREAGYIGPIIAMSGLMTEIDKDYLASFEFVAKLQKPMRFDELIDAVTEVLGDPSCNPLLSSTPLTC